MTKKTEQQSTINGINNTKIEAIKDLIFGENIAEYESEFNAIKRDLIKKKNALENLIDSTQSHLNEIIDNLSTDLNIRITDLEEHLETKFNTLNEEKMDRKQLGNMFIKLGNKISE